MTSAIGEELRRRVMVRPPALLALACAVSLFIGVEGGAA
jgi:hypothetical protein